MRRGMRKMRMSRLMRRMRIRRMILLLLLQSRGLSRGCLFVPRKKLKGRSDGYASAD
jgi:hypothetical protein